MQETGHDVVAKLTDSLRINPTILAGILNVSVRSLPNWYEKPVKTGRGKFMRLLALRSIVREALESGLSSSQILSMINRPVPEDSNERALLYYICESSDHPLTIAIARQLIKQSLMEAQSMDSSARKLVSIKDQFREQFGSINEENLQMVASSNPNMLCQLMDSRELSPQAMGVAAEALLLRP